MTWSAQETHIWSWRGGRAFPADTHPVSVHTVSLSGPALPLIIVITILVAFVAMGFLSMYLMDRLHLFTERGKGQSWRLLLCLTPLFGALLVALSRTCDYHHHWQDVLVGSILGLCIGVMCYRQYFPAKQIRTPTRTIKESELLQVLEHAAESLKAGGGGASTLNEDAAGEETKLMALSNIKWI